MFLEVLLFESGFRRREKRGFFVLVIVVRFFRKNDLIRFDFIFILFLKGFEVVFYKNWYIYLYRLVKIRINFKV